MSRRPLDDLPWRFSPFDIVIVAIVVALGLIRLVTGCAPSHLAVATATANDAREVGVAVAGVLHAACTERYEAAAALPAPARRLEVERLDSGCLPLMRAYEAYSAAHAALVAAIQAGTPSAADLARLAAAGQQLTEALHP